MFQLWVWKGTATLTLSATYPNSIAESFFAHWQCSRAASGHSPHTRPRGRAICGRHACGTSRRFSSLAARHGEGRVLQTPESSPISSSRRLRLEQRCLRPERPGMFEGCDGRFVTFGPLQSSNCLLPSFVCCLSRLLNIQLCRGLIFIIKGAEVGGGGCFDDRGMASLQGVLW